MKKKYRIYEMGTIPAYSNTYFDEFGSGTKSVCPTVLRKPYSDDNTKSNIMDRGFDSLEEAEKFVEDNLPEYYTWTIILEYEK